MPWTDAEVIFLKEHIIGTRYVDLAEMLNSHFGTTDKTDYTVKSKAQRLGISNYINKWTPEELAYLQENSSGVTYAQLSEELYSRFGIRRTPKTVQDYCARMNCKNGLDTRFKEGHGRSGKVRKIGEEIFMGRNIYVKVRDDYSGTKTDHSSEKNYKMKKVYIWEQYHRCELPEGYIVMFIDGNSQNFDPENLIAVPDGVKQKMGGRHWMDIDDPDLKKLAFQCCILECKLKGETK